MEDTNLTFSSYWAAILHCGENQAITRQTQEFRKKLFVDRMKWDLPTHDNREFDEFDVPETLYCSIFRHNNLVASWRAIRTDRPYLAKEKFPFLATNRDYPSTPTMWEISRFGVESLPQYELAADLNFSLMFAFGKQVNARSFVAVTDLKYERYLRTRSIRTRRYGPPKFVGMDGRGRLLKAVSGEIPLSIDANPNIQHFINLSKRIRIYDHTLVERPVRIPA